MAKEGYFIELPDDKELYGLVRNQFEILGYPNENPEDLKELVKILKIWLNPKIDENTYEYSSIEWALINDPECYDVLSRVQEYYVHKKRVTKSELVQMLEDIAQNKVTRRGYDFKQGCYVEEEPTFTERLQAIKILKDSVGVTDTTPAVQFVNNITMTPTPDSVASVSSEIPQTPDDLVEVDENDIDNVLQKASLTFEEKKTLLEKNFDIKTEAPKAPPEGHYSEEYMVDYFEDTLDKSDDDVNTLEDGNV